MIFKNLPRPSTWHAASLHVLVWLLVWGLPALAQTDMIEIVTDDEESGLAEGLFDVVSELAANPFDLNTATREDLEQLPFLTDAQIEELCEYLYKYGPMKSTGELALIESLDYQRRQLLLRCVYLGEQQKERLRIGELLRHGKSELTAAGHIPLYERHGDLGGYLGYRYKHWLRYTFKAGQHVQAGLLGSQDAGEPFFAGKNSAGYDHYSFYLGLSKLGALKTLVVGRYRMRFGMGLIMNNDFGFGKTATLSTLGRQANSIRPYASRSAANYLQGIASTVALAKGLDLSAFVSYRKIDATRVKNSEAVSTIRTDGYHRTQSEMSYKENTAQTHGGGNFSFSHSGFTLGATVFFTSLNRLLQPDTRQRYRQYYPQGDRFWNASINYGYRSHRLQVSGETATGDCHAFATLNTATWHAADNLDIMLLQRFYSYKYYSLFAQSFSDGGRVQNESGIYLGATWHPRRTMTVMAYTDVAYHPWDRYQAMAGSHSWDNMLSLTWQRKQWTAGGRYRLRLRERNNADDSALEWRTEQRARLWLGYQQSHWQLLTQADVAHSAQQERSLGYMLSERVTFNRKWLKASAAIGYFHTDDYDSRLYIYEPGLRYEFGFPSFYGKGIRYMLMLQAEAGKKKSLLLIAKIGTTDYFDRAHISSSYQQIDRSSKTDIDLQVRWKF
ncbi:MAG: helix-hairpin-helix domain-containing protein [Prevotella sp.]|nr:helix-hairpin-helix domain-containing protein [Prevotella sp.]